MRVRPRQALMRIVRLRTVSVGLPALLLVLSLYVPGCTSSEPLAADDARPAAFESNLLIFAGAASKPPTEEIVALFEARTGAKVDVNFGGSGTMLAEMQIAEHGDIYFPGSSDWMEVAKERALVDPGSERRIVYLVSAINVQAGNPKEIHSLEDLLRPEVRVVIANPETVCVGAYAVELLEKNLSADEIRRFREQNLVNWSDSCEKTANAVSLRAADAVIGWSCFSDWDRGRIATVNLMPDQLIRVAYIPIAVSTYARNPELARDFIDFISSEQAMEIFRKYGYFTDVEQAQEYAGADVELPVGGWYEVPEAWTIR